MKKGFTLIELSIAMIVLSIIIGSTLTLYKVNNSQQNIYQNKLSLQTIKDSLYGYAGIYGKLPSPDFNGDGIGDGVANLGDIPYLDLQVDKKDRFGMVYKYDINETLLDSNISNICQRLTDISNSSSALPRVEDNNSNSYPLAAIVISQGNDKILSGKNDDATRVYEMASNRYDDIQNNDTILEITTAELYNRLCTNVVNSTTITECNMTDPSMDPITLRIYEYDNNGVDRAVKIEESANTTTRIRFNNNSSIEIVEFVVQPQNGWVMICSRRNCSMSRPISINSLTYLKLLDINDDNILNVTFSDDTTNATINITDN